MAQLLPYTWETARLICNSWFYGRGTLRKRRGDKMKNTRNVLFALLLSGSMAGVASAQTSVAAGVHIGPSGRASVDLGFFYDDLAPYGNWIERPSYGWVWTPRAVSTSWRPYEDGHWVWTDDGWTWITDEPYGWATYHYGRWYQDPEIGWSWVPGDTWGSSWVSWQEGNDYVGWAPLPPGVNVSVGFSSGYGGYAYGIAPEQYVFVPERNFLAPRLATYIVGGQGIGAIYGRTRNCTNYRFNGGRVFNQGVPIDRIQRFGRVPQYQVADLGYGQGKSWRQPRFEGNRVAMFRPQIQKAAHIAPPIERAAARRAVMSAAQFKAAHPNRAAFRQQGQQMTAQRQQFQQNGNRQQLQAAQRQQRQAQGQRQQQVRGAELKRQQMAQRGQRQQQVAQQQRQVAQRQQQRQVVQQQRGQRQAAQRQQLQGKRQQVQVAQRQQAQAAQRQQRQATAQRQQWQGQRQQAQAAQRQQRQAPQQQQRSQQQRQAARNGGGGGPRGQGGQGNPHRPPHGPGGR
jgi:hypothetical protein